MADAARAQFLARIDTLLRQITIANGFHTDAGAQVFRTRHVLNDDERENLYEYPYIVYAVDGTEYGDRPGAPDNRTLRLSIAGYHWSDNDGDDDIVVDPAADPLGDLEADIRTAVSFLTTDSQARPTDSTELPAAPGYDVAVVTVQYVARLNDCENLTEVPQWLMNL